MPNNYPRRHDLSSSEQCVSSFASWWREMSELEILMEYRRSSPEAQATWDSILSTQIPSPNAALGLELRACAGFRAALRARGVMPCGTLLEMFVAKAWDDHLELPRLGLLAAFRLRLELEKEAAKLHSWRS
jgi:hypothetical protein